MSFTRLGLAASSLALIAGAALAQSSQTGTLGQPASNTLPQPSPMANTIPAAVDTPYPGGTIKLAVDATDTTRGIFAVTETIPVAGPGPLVLLYPKWIPGDHSPTGPISKVAGLKITANGATIPWTRDPVDVHAFHVEVPAGATSVVASFQFLSPTSSAQGPIQMTPDMLNLTWDTVSLYPAGYFVRRIPIQASVTYPTGWKSATALKPGLSGDRVDYAAIDYETLVDSPVLAGRNMRSDELAPGVRLDIAADRPDQLAATPAQINAHKRLIQQAVKLFGAQHYDHYDFLLWLSDTMGGKGLEHHRSSEDGTDANYFTEWDDTAPARNLLPHEYTHSWNGKFRRGADLWTADYRQPMGDSLLWVYEGQTQYWGYVLQARSGLVSKEDTLDQLASVAASYDNQRGKDWRSLEDTTNDPTMNQRRPIGWRSYQRAEDYYSEGQLTWLDADSIIRERTGGKKSLDDFARAFFGIRDRDWGVVTYRYQDVIDTLNKVTPYDWKGFLDAHVYQVNPKAPLDWIGRGGYRLTYVEKPPKIWAQNEADRKISDFSYSVGFTVGKEDTLSGVLWGGPAFQAGLTTGAKLVAVNGRAYDKDQLKAAITAAKGGGEPIHLLVRQNDQFRTVDVRWNGGLRYPHLEKVGKGTGGLDRLLAPKA